jgi:hypothetical protein
MGGSIPRLQRWKYVLDATWGVAPGYCIARLRRLCWTRAAISQNERELRLFKSSEEPLRESRETKLDAAFWRGSPIPGCRDIDAGDDFTSAIETSVKKCVGLLVNNERIAADALPVHSLSISLEGVAEL